MKQQGGAESKLTVRSPEMLAPARIPVAAGKKMANTEKKDSSLKSGPRFSRKMAASGKRSSKVKKIIFPMFHRSC